MNNKPLKLLVSFILVTIVSCDEPETVVTNIIHPDGSINRKIEMRRPDKKIEIADIQVPLDSTWVISDSCEISIKGDTTWVKRAEKFFKNVRELNLAYKNDTGCNSNLSRHAGFNKKFRWFNTIYSFSETVGKRFKNGYPIGDFMNKEELLWFYSPYNNNEVKLTGPDSLKYKSLSDSVDKKKDERLFKSVVSEWIGEFSEQLYKAPGDELCLDTLKKGEDRIVEIVKTNDKDFDSLWQSGFILKEFIGESNALKYRAEADSALNIVEDRLLEEFSEYSVRISMPGKLISSNGFVDSSHMLVWPVTDEYFYTEDYEMWAESRVPNTWAWVVSGVFLIFVITGVIVRKIKEG
jgi:hypothetical protein